MSAKQENETKDQEGSNAPDESKPIPNSKIEEKFDNVDLTDISQNGELDLFGGCKWTIWENVEIMADRADRKAGKDENFENKMRKVAWFDNLI